MHTGAVVALIAPSGPVSAEQVVHGLDRMRDWGFRPRPGRHLTDRHPVLGHLAGTDADRAADLMAAWTDPEVAAIWCARGGYGAQRMIDLLDPAALRRAGPKHLIGFSDITALHARLGRELDQITVHGPVATGRQLDDPASADSLRTLLSGRPGSGQLLLRAEPLVGGRAAGRLIGGNLALIADDLGIEPAPRTPSIVIIEDIGEEAYRVDRMLTRLRRSGWFSQVTGVVVGDFTGTDDPGQIAAVLADRLVDLGVPVLHRAPVGHGDRNLAVPLGAVVVLDADEATLRLA